MSYGPPVIKQCENCKKDYKCPNHRVNKSRFCTITCRNKSERLDRIEYTCLNCNDKFMALPDHGADRKFCSRKCLLETWVQPIEKECENCGGIFTAMRSQTATRGDGWRLFCSAKCRLSARSFEEKPCAVCGTLFYPISAIKNQQQKTCSMKCMAEFFTGVNSHSFQGGEFIQEHSKHKMVLVGKRKGYVGRYSAEHRVVIAKYFGRMLTRDEVVIHINNQPLDNRLSNLYLCESMSEFSRKRNGSLPWPKKSNLKEYMEKNT